MNEVRNKTKGVSRRITIFLFVIAKAAALFVASSSSSFAIECPATCPGTGVACTFPPCCFVSPDGVAECVECLSDDDCSEGNQCNVEAHTCTRPPTCSSNSDCVDPVRPICDSGNCVPCTKDAQCSPSVCNESSGQCVQCTADAECPSGLVCNDTSNTCVQCETKDNCAPDEFCNPEKFTCEKLPPPVDLTIANIEITQAIQDFDNVVPLVQDKTTYVRVYPKVDIAERRVEAQLRGFRDGMEISEPLRPVNRFVTVHPTGAKRDTLNDSFNFWVPPAWRSGTVTFQAEINPSGAIIPVPETNTSNNIFRRTRTFIAKPPVCITMIPVRTHGSLYTVNSPGFWGIIKRFESLWPVPKVNVFYQSTPISKLEPPFFKFVPYELPKNSARVLNALIQRRFFSSGVVCPSGSPFRTVGMVSPDTITGGVAGAAYHTHTVAWVQMEPFGVLFNTPPGGVTMAHELAHNFGDKNRWRHVPCPPPGQPGAPDDINPDYPYPTDQIGPDRPDAFWGFDPISKAIISPKLGKDFMSYCPQEWVSDYSWENIFFEINLRTVAARSHETGNALVDPHQNAEILVVGGVIAPATNVATFDYGYRLSQDMVSAETLEEVQPDQDTTSDPETTYGLELLDTSGAVLSSLPFEPIKDTATENAEQGFFLTVPFDSRTARVRITRNGKELGGLTVSANAPQVRLLQPIGGEVITDRLTIRWEASDQDNDPLFYTVQYSPDSGASWQTLVTQTPETTLTLDDTLSLPGSDQALIQVIASDGVNTGSATSDSFTVQSHAPVVHIDTPSNQAIFAFNSQVIFTGGARDAEDGPLGDESLKWLLNGQVLGIGEEIALDELAPGDYDIMLEAEDSDNNKAVASVTITIVDGMPVASNDSYSTPENTPLTVDAPGVLGNDIDAEGDPLSAILVSDVSKGTLTLNADGSFTYTPSADFNGTDSFTYKANDSTADSNVVTVSLTIGIVSIVCPDCIPQIVNDLVTFNPIKSTFRTTSDTSGCPSGFVGKFSFESRLTNISDSSLSDLTVQVAELTNENLLQNANGGPDGVGAILTVPSVSAYSDGILSPEESVDVPFVICLKNKNPFRFFVDVLGIVQ
ncbi:MAG TPA: Ig-like domain-containing protein [Thermodesulfobacteriota bacterium]|nr:Ig-like domain-containing protein [Thermodesulfobacteriota bacterium]